MLNEMLLLSGILLMVPGRETDMRQNNTEKLYKNDMETKMLQCEGDVESET